MNVQNIVFHFIDMINDRYGRKNIFYMPYNERTFLLQKEMADFLTLHQRGLVEYLRAVNPGEREKFFTHVTTYSAQKTAETLVALNQFIDLDRPFMEQLHCVYDDFTSKFFKTLLSSTSERSHNWMVPLVLSHQNRLRAVLGQVEELQIFSRTQQYLEPVPCFEYSASMQLDMLGISQEEFLEPVLDIGCGTQAHLVHFLRKKGLETYGMDRAVENAEWTIKRSWFDTSFGQNSWGTIISHLSFTHHFARNHARQHGKYAEYAMAYMNILRSLKIDGSFYYTPGLPFIEQFLSPKIYHIKKKVIPGKHLNLSKSRVHAVQITKLTQEY